MQRRDGRRPPDIRWIADRRDVVERNRRVGLHERAERARAEELVSGRQLALQAVAMPVVPEVRAAPAEPAAEVRRAVRLRVHEVQRLELSADALGCLLNDRPPGGAAVLQETFHAFGGVRRGDQKLRHVDLRAASTRWTS